MNGIGTTAVAALVAAGIGTGAIELAANLLAPPGIYVHELRYQSGSIIQDRTVIAGGPDFAATFDVRITPASAPAQILCNGGDGWLYKPGHLTAAIPVDEWTRDPGCLARLPRGERLVATATWRWGGDETTATSAPFVLE